MHKINKKYLYFLLASLGLIALFCIFLNSESERSSQETNDSSFANRRRTSIREKFLGFRNRKREQVKEVRQEKPTKVSISGKYCRITAAAAEELGLSIYERAQAQQAIDRLILQMEESMAQRIEYDNDSSLPEEDLYVFRIKSLDDQGASFRKEIESTLIQLLGERNGTLLMEGWSPGKAYGGYGKYDAKVTFSQRNRAFQTENQPKRQVISMTYTDPNTGEIVSTNHCTKEVFKEYWGNLFDF